jgi:hypothetical protein
MARLTAMQVVLRGNNEYDELIKERYDILESLDSMRTTNQ